MLSRENNFDLIRLFAAFQVVLGHGLFHLKIKEKHLIFNIMSHFPGVLIFFTVSGYLIFSAFDRNQNLRRYAVNRFLRIYPALWICFILTVVLMLSFGGIRPADLATFTFLKWTITQISFLQFWTPDLLRNWGVGTPNGSLWTIPVELQFYILLPVLVLSFRRIRLEYRILLLFLLSLAFNAFLSGYQGDKETTLSKLAGVSLLPYLYCFLTGALLYLFREKLRFILEGKALYWLLIFGLYCYFSGESPSYFPGIVQMPANLLLSFLTISFAYTAPGMGRILHGNDISYGLYIYHMPIVNTLLSLGLFGSTQHLLLAFGLTTGMGLLSWLLVEKKALELKRHFAA